MVNLILTLIGVTLVAGVPVDIDVAVAKPNPKIAPPALHFDDSEKAFMDERGPGDDIISTPGSQIGPNSGIIGDKYRWTGGKVYVDIDPAFSESETNQILRGIEGIRSKTCITFFYKGSTTPDWVRVRRGAQGSGCNSMVGKRGGEQILNLEPACVTSVGTISHEFIHAIGFHHEQCRTDRDDWVTIVTGNIQPGKEHNFNKYSATEVNPEGRGYDYKSIMHYSGYAFALNSNSPTIIPKASGWSPGDLGQRDGLTPWDADKINHMYATWC